MYVWLPVGSCVSGAAASVLSRVGLRASTILDVTATVYLLPHGRFPCFPRDPGSMRATGWWGLSQMRFFLKHSPLGELQPWRPFTALTHSNLRLLLSAPDIDQAIPALIPILSILSKGCEQLRDDLPGLPYTYPSGIPPFAPQG